MLIDTDAAADDMLALILALRNDSISVDAITVVSGACSSHQGVQNVLYLLDLLGVSVPVFKGRLKPLFGPLRDSTHIMGADGLGDIGLPLKGRIANEKPACDKIREYIRTKPKQNTIVCLGPLTNLALAILTEPELAALIGRLVVMGGVSDGVGNITPAAEFNIWADPEAARVVFESGVHCELVGWDVSRSDTCSFSSTDLSEIKNIGTPLAHFSVDILSGLRTFLHAELGIDNVDLPDPIAMAIALNRDVCSGWVKRHVQIDDSQGPSRGATIVDHLQSGGNTPNVSIATGANKAIVFDMLKTAVMVE